MIVLSLILFVGILIAYQVMHTRSNIKSTTYTNIDIQPLTKLTYPAPVKPKLDMAQFHNYYYPDAFLFNNISYAEVIRNYCQTHPVGSAVELSNCNSASKMSNIGYVIFFALSSESGRMAVFRILSLIFMLYFLFKYCLKELFKILFITNRSVELKKGKVKNEIYR